MTRRSCRGLTLIELMVAIAIIGVIAIVAWPSYQSSLTRSRLAGAAEVLAQDMQLARSLAIKDSCQVTLTVNLSSGSSWSYQVIKADQFNDSDPTIGYCSNPCTAATGDCTLRSVSGSDYRNVALNSTFLNNEVKYDPVRSIVNSGEVVLTATTGDAVKILLSSAGMVMICTSAGSAGYPAC